MRVNEVSGIIYFNNKILVKNMFEHNFVELVLVGKGLDKVGDKLVGNKKHMVEDKVVDKEVEDKDYI